MTIRNEPSTKQPIFGQMSGLDRRTYELERRQTVSVLGPVLAHLFSYPGALVQGTESPPWYPEIAVTLVQTRVSLLVASANNVVITVKMNGTTQYTVTLTAGQTTTVQPQGVVMGPTDFLTVVVTTVTTASNLSVGFIPQL